jgi:hypothetical protein
MQRGFKFTDLEDGERIVFGPITFTQTTSLSGGAGAGQSSVSKTSGRTVGVTNQRVIVEDLDSPGKTQTCANADVQRVYVQRKQRRGQLNVDLTKVQTASGQTIKLGIMGSPTQRSSRTKSALSPPRRTAVPWPPRSWSFASSATTGSGRAGWGAGR